MKTEHVVNAIKRPGREKKLPAKLRESNPGGWGVQIKVFRGGYGYFLEPHILSKSTINLAWRLKRLEKKR